MCWRIVTPGYKRADPRGQSHGIKIVPGTRKTSAMRRIACHRQKICKRSKDEQNEPKLEKVNKSQLSGNEKSTKVNSRENFPNIETNLPLVVKMRKEAPKPKFNRFKVLETGCFCENNLRGALENAYKTQIWRRKCCGRQERKLISAAKYRPQVLD